MTLRHRILSTILVALVLGLLAEGPAGLHSSRASPQAPQRGKVLFDETHGVISDPWHGRYSIDEAYRDWAERLRQKGYDVAANRTSSLTLPLLSQYDVCVLALPTRSFSPEEVAALRTFVANGGGLLLLADAFGGGTVLNPISQEFGITINPDVLADWDDSRPIRPFHFFTHTWPRPGPLTAHVDLVMYDWGSSLTLQNPAWAFGTGDPDTWVDDGDGQREPGEPTGFPAGMAAAEYGAGRVVVIGDANLFMNMYSREFDNAQLSANVIDWLAVQEPTILEPNTFQSAHFKLSVPDAFTDYAPIILQTLEQSYALLTAQYGGEPRYRKIKVQLESSLPGCRAGCTNCIYNIWSDLSDPYFQGRPLVPAIYDPLLAELEHIFSGTYLGPLWLDTQYQWLGEGLGNWWKAPVLAALGYPDMAQAVDNWITWAGEEYQRRGYTWISRWNQNNPDQDRDLGYGMSAYIARQLDRRYGNEMWRRFFGLVAERERELASLSDDRKNSYAVCFFVQASGDPTLIDVFTQQWHFQTESILWASPPRLVFAHPYGSETQHFRQVQLLNCSGRQMLTWTVSLDPQAPWLSVDRTGGQTPGGLLVSVNPGGLITGTYESSLQFTAPNSLNSPLTLPVTLMVGVYQVHLPLVSRGH
ncbi:MAG: DUF4350 domain-containing protein [Anaerolineae bacterium]